jgi:hypothetical protein
MKAISLIALACPTLFLLACSADGPAVGQIDAWNRAGVQSLYVSIVQPGTPAAAVSDAGEYQGNPVTVGACTYFPPPTPPGGPAPGSGTPSTGANAGTISIVDTTSRATLGTYPYSSDGYTPLSGTSLSAQWQSGDTLTATAAGGGVGAFTISVRALSSPSITFPSTFSAAQDMTLTWTPDPNAQSMTVAIADDIRGSFVGCHLADSLGTVTIDSSLFASFVASDGFTVSAYRETDETLQDGNASIEMRSFGATSSVSIVLN